MDKNKFHSDFFKTTTRSLRFLKDTKSTKKNASGGSLRVSFPAFAGTSLKSWASLRQGFARHANGLGLEIIPK